MPKTYRQEFRDDVPRRDLARIPSGSATSGNLKPRVEPML